MSRYVVQFLASGETVKVAPWHLQEEDSSSNCWGPEMSVAHPLTLRPMLPGLPEKAGLVNLTDWVSAKSRAILEDPSLARLP